MSDGKESSNTEQIVQVVQQDALVEQQPTSQPETKPDQPQSADPTPHQVESPKPADRSPELIETHDVESPKPQPKTESMKRFFGSTNDNFLRLGKGWGWGWGIISSVSSKVGEYVKPALDTVGDTGNFILIFAPVAF